MSQKVSIGDAIWMGSAAALILAGAARFIAAGILPASESLHGDFAATFPTAYFASLRPDFPTDAVWGIPQRDWNYGPMVHFLTLPLLLLPTWELVAKIWAGANIVLVAVSFALVLGLAGPPATARPVRVAALAGLWLLYQPLINVFVQGVEILELAIVLGALLLLRRGRELSAGMLFGVATMVKFLPIGFILWSLARSRVRVLIAGTATIGGIALITALTLGWDHSITLRSPELAAAGGVAGWHELSFTSLVVHRTAEIDWLAQPPGIDLSADARRAAAATGFAASAVLTVAYGALFVARRRHPVTPLDVAILFLLMFLLPPWNHDYYYVFALVPISVLILHEGTPRSRITLPAAFAGYLLISPPVPFGWIDRLGWFPARFAYVLNLNDVPLFGALVLLIACTFLVLKEWRAGLDQAPRDEASDRGGVSLPLKSARLAAGPR